jgi:hypothetical protein
MQRSAAVGALAAIVAALLVSEAAPAASGTTVLRLDGVGPLHLGMTRAAAVKTGWLAGRGKGCELGGDPPITYRFTGAKAPRGLSGSVEFADGRLKALSFSRGVRTVTGVKIGTTTARTVTRYRDAGFTASSEYVDTFGGSFITVKHRGRQVLGGFAERGRVSILAVPFVSVCE